ncbi:hypothetical protein HNY73_021880 [Argiope bruennichi]|uniref:Uncharacterized protein n=2 Tax=Argiope bruennichi TaxID=94029 RepID=A0A8T0E2Q7_ARGBR|nr:hypothetical protein HNY73_021880 [Argiope bruennichi]
MLKDKVSPSIKNSICHLCREIGICYIWLEEKDKHILGPEFPKSIMYGIKDESSATLENLRKLLLKLSTKRKLKSSKKDAASFIDISSNEMELSSTERTTNQEVLNTSTFYHIHEGHVSKKSNQEVTGFLSLNKFSSDEKETDFLDYDSVACSGLLSIK